MEKLYYTGHSGKKNISVDKISKLIEVGGRELLMMKAHDGCDVLHYALYYSQLYSSNEKYYSAFKLLVKECILANIGGEFGIGGLFNVARQKTQNKIYEKWEKLSPSVKSAIVSLQEEHSKQPPPSFMQQSLQRPHCMLFRISSLSLNIVFYKLTA